LLEVLEKGGHKKASEEVISVLTYHIGLFKKSGVKLELEKYY
jgi:hypothetical protein